MEARAYEHELERRRGDRAATQRRYRRLKQREAAELSSEIACQTFGAS